VVRAYQKPGREPCSVERCTRPLYCRTYCVMHYNRTLKGSTLGGPESLRAPNGSGSVIPDGYRILNLRGHPLARAQSKVPEHRAVLFAKIGPGEHPCHWCGKTLGWGGRQSRKIMADHVDWDRLNNTPENLVPACLDCNTKRRQAA
jgi:hypothetical protein